MTEPIAFFDLHKGFYWAKPTKINAPVTVDVEPLSLYAQRTWTGLTDEEINLIYAEPQTHIGQYAKAIETKLKEKNT